MLTMVMPMFRMELMLTPMLTTTSTTHWLTLASLPTPMEPLSPLMSQPSNKPVLSTLPLLVSPLPPTHMLLDTLDLLLTPMVPLSQLSLLRSKLPVLSTSLPMLPPYKRTT